MVETRSRTNGKGVSSALSEYVDEKAVRLRTKPIVNRSAIPALDDVQLPANGTNGVSSAAGPRNPPSYVRSSPGLPIAQCPAVPGTLDLGSIPPPFSARPSSSRPASPPHPPGSSQPPVGGPAVGRVPEVTLPVKVELASFELVMRRFYPHVEVVYSNRDDAAWYAEIEAAIYGTQDTGPGAQDPPPGFWLSKWRAFCRLYQIQSTTIWSVPYLDMPELAGAGAPGAEPRPARKLSQAIEFDATLRPTLQVVESYCRGSSRVEFSVKMVPNWYILLVVAVCFYVADIMADLGLSSNAFKIAIKTLRSAGKIYAQLKE
ncbi:hypothetical protein ABW21_db0208674 [Orbilia brochopaga]|nr:hypothetical protein ABW21_db0208674 [Drechslerella brochopaga]